MNTLTAIIPIYNLNDDKEKGMFANCIQSINELSVKPDKVIVAVAKGSNVKKYLEDFDYGSIKGIVEIFTNTNGFSFTNQINQATTQIKTDFFAYIEFDDVVGPEWVSNFKKYAAEAKKSDIYLPIVAERSVEGKFVGMTNEVAWAYNFSNDQGYLDLESTLSYNNFNLSGAFIRTALFEEVGKYKESMKFTFNQELLLRMIHNNARVYVIPKMSYYHTNQRPGSLFENYRETLSEAEIRFWVGLPRKEFHFSVDREISFVPASAQD